MALCNDIWPFCWEYFPGLHAYYLVWPSSVTGMSWHFQFKTRRLAVTSHPTIFLDVLTSKGTQHWLGKKRTWAKKIVYWSLSAHTIFICSLFRKIYLNFNRWLVSWNIETFWYCSAFSAKNSVFSESYNLFAVRCGLSTWMKNCRLPLMHKYKALFMN